MGLTGFNRQLSLGPEAALSLLIGQMIQDLVYGDPHTLPKHPELEAAAIAIVTTFQVGRGAINADLSGGLDHQRPWLITTRFPRCRTLESSPPRFHHCCWHSACFNPAFIACLYPQIIFIEQLVPMLGLATVLAHPGAHIESPTLPIPKLIFIIRHLKFLNKTTASISFSCLAFLIVARVIKQRLIQRPGATWVKYVPEILLVCVSTTALCSTLRWDLQGVDILGKVEGGHGLPFGWPLGARAMKYFSYTVGCCLSSANTVTA
jgi:MFS superfamily sulfate permease-like transporter